LALKQIIGYDFIPTLLFILIMGIVHFFQEKGSLREILSRQLPVLKWTLYVGVVVAILVFGKIYSEPTSFIYFQF